MFEKSPSEVASHTGSSVFEFNVGVPVVAAGTRGQFDVDRLLNLGLSAFSP